jgi:hypothetical protein
MWFACLLILRESGGWLFKAGFIALLLLNIIEYIVFADYASAWYPDTHPGRSFGQMRFLELAFSRGDPDDSDFLDRQRPVRAVLIIYACVLVVAAVMLTNGVWFA